MYHDQVGFISGIPKDIQIIITHKQNKWQKSHDHLNKCKKKAFMNANIYSQLKNKLKENSDRRTLSQSDQNSL